MDSVLACRTYLATASIVVTNTACMATVVLEPKRWMNTCPATLDRRLHSDICAGAALDYLT